MRPVSTCAREAVGKPSGWLGQWRNQSGLTGRQRSVINTPYDTVVVMFLDEKFVVFLRSIRFVKKLFIPNIPTDIHLTSPLNPPLEAISMAYFVAILKQLAADLATSVGGGFGTKVLFTALKFSQSAAGGLRNEHRACPPGSILCTVGTTPRLVRVVRRPVCPYIVYSCCVLRYIYFSEKESSSLE